MVSLSSAWREELASVRAVAVSSDDTRVAVAYNDRTVDLRCADTGQRLATFAHHQASAVSWGTDVSVGKQSRGSQVTCLAFSHSGDRLAVGFSGGALHIWNCRDAQRSLGPVAASVSALAWSADGSKLLVGRRSGDVDLVTSAGRLIKSMSVCLRNPPQQDRWKYIIRGAAWHHEDPWVITAGGRIKMWPARPERVEWHGRTKVSIYHEEGGQLSGVHSAHMAGDGQRMVIFVRSGVDLQYVTGDQILTVGQAHAMDEVWGGNEEYILLGQGDPYPGASCRLARIALWQVKTGKVCEQKVAGFVCAALSFSSNSVYVASSLGVQKFSVQINSLK